MIPKLPFGRTGHNSTRALFGAAALSDVTQQEADQTLDVLLKYGVNHIDVAASYGDAELRIGPWMKDHRKDFFLATKTGDRSYEDAKASIQRSLERLRVDQLDLIQFHAVIEEDEWQQVFSPGGALDAALEAKKNGLVRFIGITSHSLRAPMMHKRSLERFDFDSVLLPYNYMLMQEEQYAKDFNELMRVCHEKNVAVQLIKTNQRRKWGEDEKHFASTWYVPFTEQDAIDKALWWAMGTQPTAFLNSSGDIHVLPNFLEAASKYTLERVPSDDQMQAMIEDKEGVPLWP